MPSMVAMLITNSFVSLRRSKLLKNDDIKIVKFLLFKFIVKFIPPFNTYTYLLRLIFGYRLKE